MKKIYLLILMMAIYSCLQAQTLIWAKQFSGTGGEYGNCVVVDALGNVYTTGAFSGTVDFNPGAATFNLTAAGDLDIFVSKLDAAGNFVWAKGMGGTATDIGNSIAIDASGNIYTTGEFQGTADFDPGAAPFNLTSAGLDDIFISKLDAAGNFVWAIRFGSTAGEAGLSNALDASGNVYTTGAFRGTVDFDPGGATVNLTSAGLDDIFISKLDAAGNFVYVRRLGGTSNDVGYSIAVDATGNVHTSGYFIGTADFDPGAATVNLTSAGQRDIFVSKLDAVGNFVWAKQMGGTTNDNGNSVTLDASGNVYLAGDFSGTADFDPGAATVNLTSAGLADIFVSKLDAAGNFVFAKGMGGTGIDIASMIKLDAAGNIHTAGGFELTVDFDPGAGTFNLTSAGLEEIFISKLNTTGNFVYAVRLGGTLGDVPTSIAVDASGNIYTTGAFEGTADFDPGTGSFNLTAAGDIDVFVHKMSQAIADPPPTVTINQAAGQADPTGTSPINFTVVFNETVTGFATGDVTLSGTAGATTATVTGSGTTYNVAVSGMTANGTVIATIAAGVAIDAGGNPNTASTSTDNTVTYTGIADPPPTVTINQAAGQADPTGTSPINFTVVFNETVTGFATGDVTLSGTAGATTATVTGSGTTYTVAVSGMTANGTVIATIAAGVAIDAGGNPNTASTSTDNTVTYTGIADPPPTVTINQAAAQADPTGTSPINFTVVFNETVTGFATGDVTLSGTAGATTATVTGSGTTYNVAVSGMTANGTVIATIAAGVATDAGGNPNLASTSTDNTVTYTGIPDPPPTVTINQAAAQADPTATSPINFTVVFNETVTGFATGDVTLSGTAGATTATVTGSGTTYNVAVSGMTANGTVIATIAAGVATDAGGNPNTASTSTDNTVTYTGIVDPPPTVTINQAAAQADPTGASPINFTVVFNETVTGFATGDVTLSGTAGATTATVTGSGTTYNVAVSGMTANGTVIATIAAGVANDAGGNPNTASTSTDNTVTYTGIADPPPTVTINQAAGQADPTGTSPINFTVVFNETVTGFATGDVTLTGTVGATTATVTGSGTTYNVAVSGMTANGTVIATIAAGVAIDAGGNPNLASTSTDNTVSYTGIADPPPTVTINQAAAQADPTATSPINFTVVFNETVTGFATGDVTLSGTAGATTATVTGSGTTYNVAVSGMTANGTVIATIAAGVATDAGGNPNLASTSTDNTVTYTGIPDPPPTVTINQAAAQADPTATSPINFTVVFNETVTGFATGDVTLSGTAGATTATVTGSGTTYNVAVSGMTANGTVIATIAAGVATDAGGNPNLASTSTDNTVTYTGIPDPPPTVTINQAAGQADPTGTSPINFTVVFNETVTGFATGDVTLSGTAGATTTTVTGSGTTYNVAVSGMTANGTVIATIAAGVAIDAGGNPNTASTSTDNTVTYTGIADPPPTVTINQAAAQADPTAASPINFTVIFNETVTGFATGDVTLSGTAGATTATVTGSGTTYTVAVSGMTANGTVIATIAAGVAIDAGGNPNTASTSTDNTVTYTGIADPPPTVTINQAAGQADPTGTSPINFTVVFNETVTGFATGDVTLSGTAGAATATVTGSGTTYNVAISGMTANGTVIATIAAGVANDAGGNPNTASTSTDNTVTYTGIVDPPPTVTINQAAGQADPTATSPINFTVVFNETVTGFATGDVTLSGTAGATTATVTGSGTTYNVAVSGMTANGTVIATIAAGVANDAGSNPNTASTSTDNTVQYNGIVCTITCPANITVSNTGSQCGAIVNYPAPVGSGSCGTITSSPASGSFFPVGTTTVNVTSTAGATCSFTVTVTGGQEKIIIYPVPSSDGNLKIAVCTEMAGATVKAYDIKGRKVRQWIIGGGLNTYLFNWQQGVYLLDFVKGSLREVKTIVIAR